MGITYIMSLLAGAVEVIGAFKGSASAARTTGYIQEAIGVVTALTPLVKTFGSGLEVTLEDARKALEGKDAALAALDKAIAEKEAP